MRSDLVEQFRRRRELQAIIRRRRPTLRRTFARQRFPTTIELSYRRNLLDLASVAHRAVREVLVPLLPELVAAQARIHRADAPAGDVDETLGIIRTGLGGVLSSSNLERIVQPIGNRVSTAQRDQLQRQMQAAIGIEVPIHDRNFGEQLGAWTEENVGLIKTIPEEYLAQVQKVVVNGLTAGDRWESIATDLEERFGVAESRAALIARDQVGKFYGSLQRARQTNLGIEGYTWRTAQDERVREEHADREGELFKWDDPPEDGHPGFPINCRCTADPDIEAMLEALAAEEA